MTNHPNRSRVPTVIIHLDLDGYPAIRVIGNPVRVLWIDETAPDDRVYEMTARDDPAIVAELIGDSPVGHIGDDAVADNKMQAIRARIARARGDMPTGV